MEKLYVYADFDWLKQPALIGVLSLDSVRANQTCSFEFDRDWLTNNEINPEIILSADLKNFAGMQYVSSKQDLQEKDGQEKVQKDKNRQVIFGCFSDVCPQRWGRTLFKYWEQNCADSQNRNIGPLTWFDYLKAIDDTLRIGALRFSTGKADEFISLSNSSHIPRKSSISSVREFMHAANEVERSIEKKVLPTQKVINQLFITATALGGARPKASIMGEGGELMVAKFPSIKDDYDVEGWEHWSHIMARKAGISTAQTRIIPGEKYHILLSKRFDRTPQGKRIHFASALTLLGLTDGNNASTNNGYLDIVDFLIQHGATAEKDLEQLYRRVAFNIIIGNSDDHFRNHGFLLTCKGWVLSPAYDLNPTLLDSQSLLVNSSTNESDLNILVESASEYMLTQAQALSIIDKVQIAMRSWKKEAQRLNLPKRDIDMFAPRIDKWL